MYAAFVGGLLATVILLIAVSTDYWVTVELAYSQYRNDTGRDSEFYKTGHYHGLWRICRQEYINTSTDTDTPYHSQHQSHLLTYLLTYQSHLLA